MQHAAAPPPPPSAVPLPRFAGEDSRDLADRRRLAEMQRTITPVDGSVYIERPLASLEEVARAVLWLVGPGSDAVTGQAISVSGGETW